jgi:Flp pilus assembly protein TadG
MRFERFEPRGGLRPSTGEGPRRGAAALELVLLLPMLCFIGLASIDYSRLFYAWATLADCARNGALFASDPSFATSTNFTTIQQAAQADATNLSPLPTVTSTTGNDSNGIAYVKVTVTYTFQTVVSYPGIPSSVTLTRALQMAATP